MFPPWLVSVLAIGLVLGSLAGLNSIAFVLLWRTTRVVNLAQPALGLLGGTVVGLLVVRAGWTFWWAAPIGIVVGAGLGIAAERAVLVRLQDVPRSVLLIATIGLAQVLDGIRIALPFIFGGELPTYQLDLGFTLDLFPVRLFSAHILAIVALPVVAAGVHLFLSRSRLGVAALALGQDTERARALGIPAALVRTAVWGLAGGIAAIAGTLSIPVMGFGLGSNLAPIVLLLALAPAVFAGLRSLWGAALAAVLLGIAYQGAVRFSAGGGLSVIVLAVAVLLAVATQAQRLGRDETAARASAWEAAATTRPLPWRVAASSRVYTAAMAVTVVAIVAAAVPPMLLSPSLRVSYGTAAALALAAVGVGIAWLFAGELPLGHWGFAGLGAALGTVVPGPWGARALVSGIAVAALTGVAGFATRRRSTLSFAVVGLAAAAAAPVAVLEVGRGVIRADTATVGAVGGVLAVLAVVATTKLRSTTFGARLVAARDDPERAKWLGVDPVRSRVIALAMSGFVVGVAGVVFVASLPAGIAEGSFDIDRSLALLAMAVVGGISSPTGVLLGAIALVGAERLLPPPWNGLTSGVGVIAVVLFLPAGFARVLERVRDAFVRVLVREAGDAEAPAMPREVPA